MDAISQDIASHRSLDLLRDGRVLESFLGTVQRLALLLLLIDLQPFSRTNGAAGGITTIVPTPGKILG